MKNATIERDSTDTALHNLAMACKKQTDTTAMWVLYAVERHILTDRASDFVKKFTEISKRRWPSIISKCLDGDMSDDGIIATIKKEIFK